MKKIIVPAVALAFMGIAGTGAAQAAATEIETVTVTGQPIITVSENPGPPTSYRALQRERLRYFKANGTPRHNTYAEAVLRGCYWDDLGKVCRRF